MVREHQRELKLAGVDWQHKVNAAINTGTAEALAEREQRRQERAAAAKERRAEQQAWAAARVEADSKLARLESELEQQRAATERLRGSRAGGELERRRALEEENAKLKQRRGATQRKVSEANLDRRRWQVQQQESQRLRAVINENWDKGTLELAERTAAAEERRKLGTFGMMASFRHLHGVSGGGR